MLPKKCNQIDHFLGGNAGKSTEIGQNSEEKTSLWKEKVLGATKKVAERRRSPVKRKKETVRATH